MSVAMLLALALTLARWIQRGELHRRQADMAKALCVWLTSSLLLTVAAVLAGQSRIAPAVLVVLPLPWMLFPWWTARLVTIRLGWVRPSYHLAKLSFALWRGDAQGAGFLAAGLAYGRRTKPDPATREWIDARIRRDELGAGSIASAALLSHYARGRSRARRLFSSVLALHPERRPASATRFAGDWLVADAVTEGRWHVVGEIAMRLDHVSRDTKFLITVAARLCSRRIRTADAEDPSDLQLRLRWILAPRRVAVRPLLERALQCPRQQPRRAKQVDEAEARSPAPDARAIHVAVAARSGALLPLADVQLLIDTWDRTLADPELQERTIRRALALGAKNPRDAVRRWRSEVEQELVTLIREHRVPAHRLTGDGRLLAALRRQLSDDVLSAVEIAGSALDSRCDQANSPLPALEEWEQWLGLVALYEDAAALAGPTARRMAFRDLHRAGCSLAVWLWNDRDQKLIGNAIFTFLLAEAVRVDDAEAAELQRRNVACGAE